MKKNPEADMESNRRSYLVILILILVLAWQMGELAMQIAEIGLELTVTAPVAAIGLEQPIAAPVKENAALDYESVPLRVALAFDDGLHPVYTEILLDGLAERDAVAIFHVAPVITCSLPVLVVK